MPFVTSLPGYYLAQVYSKAVAYNMSLAVAVAVDWDTYMALPTLGAMLLYTWEPAVQYIDLVPPLQMLMYPPDDGRINRYLKAQEEIALTNVIAANLVNLAPRARWLLSRITLTTLEIRELLQLYLASGSYSEAACTWLTNSTKWRRWVLPV